MAPSSNGLRGRRQKRQRSHECSDFMYYDEAISSCTPCDHLCDNYEVQATEKQCIEKCYKYYMRSRTTQSTLTTTTTTRKPLPSVTRLTESGPIYPRREVGLLETDKGNAILAVVVVLLTLAISSVVGYMVWKRRKDIVCCRRRRAEDIRTSVPCSEEDGLHNVGDSKKPLMGSSGPICQVETCPQQELSDVKRQLAESGSSSIQYPMTFARYALLDGPLTSVHRHSTIPKEAYHEDSAPLRESHVHVTTPKETFSDVTSEHLNTQSVRSERKCSTDREHDLSTS